MIFDSEPSNANQLWIECGRWSKYRLAQSLTQATLTPYYPHATQDHSKKKMPQPLCTYATRFYETYRLPQSLKQATLTPYYPRATQDHSKKKRPQPLCTYATTFYKQSIHTIHLWPTDLARPRGSSNNAARSAACCPKRKLMRSTSGCNKALRFAADILRR